MRPSARLVLVGDPEQLVSVEAGAVLGDIVQLDHDTEAGTSATGTAISESIVVLERVHRFGGAIAELAAAVQRGDSDAVVDVLRGGA